MRLVGFLLPAILLSASPPSALAQPAVVGPGEFYGFMLLHRALSTEIAARRNANLPSADGLEEAAAARYSLPREEFRRIMPVLEAYFRQLDEVTKEAVAYTQKAGAKPDITILKALHERRQGILQAAARATRDSMTAEAWEGLRQYIETVVRKIDRKKQVAGTN